MLNISLYLSCVTNSIMALYKFCIIIYYYYNYYIPCCFSSVICYV